MSILEEQLSFVPEVVGEAVTAPVLICGGMGGSALPALALRFLEVSRYVMVHRDYGLPVRVPPKAACIAISYSGETEETLSFAKAALEASLPLAVITTGGTLLAFAKEHGLPYVVVPTGPEPRDSILSMTKALLALVGEEPIFDGIGISLQAAAEDEGSRLAEVLEEAIPVFYASVRNEALSYIAKIQVNETAKSPAFSNVFSEMNHNELQGFDLATNPAAAALVQPFITVFLRDDADNKHIRHRMELTEQLLAAQGMRTARLSLPNGSRAETFLAGWWTARTLAQTLAEKNGIPADATPLIDALKGQL